MRSNVGTKDPRGKLPYLGKVVATLHHVTVYTSNLVGKFYAAD